MVSYCHEILLKDYPSFIRFYSPDRHSEKLDIPKEFNENFNGKIPKNVTLKSIGGKVWEAEVEDDDGNLHFAKGWENYAQDNDLKLGDLLMFKYLPNDSADFYVIAFAENGAIKDDPAAEEINDDDTSSESSAKETSIDFGSEDHEESVDESSDDLVFVRDFNIRFKSWVGVPKRVLKTFVLDLPQKVKLESETGIGIMTKLRHATDRVILGYKGLPWFWKANKTKIRDKLEFRLILVPSGNGIEKIVVRKIDFGSEDHEESVGETTDDLVFVKDFNIRFKSWVGVPQRVLEKFVLDLPQKVKLEYETGNCIMTKLRWATGRVILGYNGLSWFWKANKIKIVDKLEFRLILGPSGDRIEKIIVRKIGMAKN